MFTFHSSSGTGWWMQSEELLMCYYKIQWLSTQWNTGRGGANSTVFNKSAQIEIAFYYNISSIMQYAIMSLFVFSTF